MPVCSVVGGPVSAVADTPSPLDCPRARPGCQAAFLPPVSSARHSHTCCALPHPSAPRGAQQYAPASLRSGSLRLDWRVGGPLTPRPVVLVAGGRAGQVLEPYGASPSGFRDLLGVRQAGVGTGVRRLERTPQQLRALAPQRPAAPAGWADLRTGGPQCAGHEVVDQPDGTVAAGGQSH
jgi:hypothetical protein